MSAAATRGGRWPVYLYLFAFFLYLFGPLIIMAITAFNSASFPRMSPWECFTTEWFAKLAQDERLMEGLRHSLIIGFGVVALAVPLGMAGAIMLSQATKQVRSVLYTVLISPILMPGVVIGISTLLFWDRLGVMMNAGINSMFYNSTALTIIGQASFISAYSMLVFLARLQRFDSAQEEAALDLGASHWQTFRRILLPFLAPAIGSAAVLAFLASFENYNTTVFTVLADSTLTTVLAGKVRLGIDPSISALAVIIVAITLIGAILHEIWTRSKAAKARARALEGIPMTRAERAARAANPMVIMGVMIVIATMATISMAASFDTKACKLRVEEEKRQKLESLVPPVSTPAASPASPAPSQPTVPSAQQPASPFGNVFNPGNLAPGGAQPQAPAEQPAQPAPQPSSPFGNVFNPSNLAPSGNSGQ